MKKEDELTYGETIKQPFPKLEDIEEKISKLLGDEFEIDCGGLYKDKEFTVIASVGSFSSRGTKWGDVFNAVIRQIEGHQLKQTDPHAEIKAQHEEALNIYDVVKFKTVWDNRFVDIEWVNSKPEREVTMHCYNIDWNKLLSWSYANGEFVKCEFTNNTKFINPTTVNLMGLSVNGRFLTSDGTIYSFCRLAPSVTIKDEWLKEVE